MKSAFFLYLRSEYRQGELHRGVRLIEAGARGRPRRVIANLPVITGNDAIADQRFEQALDEGHRMLVGLRGHAA